MSVFDVNGNDVSKLYSVDGNELVSAFDKSGKQVFPDSVTLKVMTYNVQYFNGINEQTAMQTEIINKYTPDIIGMQELGTYTASTLPTVGKTMLNGYTLQLSNHKNKVMMATKGYSLSNIVIADYEHQDPQDLSQYNETRAYIKADINVGGKVVTFINTHLCYLTESVKWQQMEELFAIAQQCEYVIITGDFNSMQMSAEAGDYIHMYKPFVDAGYHLANNSPTAGFTNTYTNTATATSLAELQTAPDTIIVSGNIDIESVVFDPTKFSYLNGSVIDHIPLIAEVTVS